jgi:hypothetical protein
LDAVSGILELTERFESVVGDLVLHPAVAEAASVLPVASIFNVFALLVRLFAPFFAPVFAPVDKFSYFMFWLICIPLNPRSRICDLSDLFAYDA